MSDAKEQVLKHYFQDGERWENEIVKKAKRSQVLAWFVTLFFGVITLLSLTALVLLTPLKSFEPYIVEVDKNTGYIEVLTGLTRPTYLSENTAVTQANIVRYIRAREGYDPYAISENFGIATLLSTGAAAEQLQALYSPSNPQNPARVNSDDTTIAVTVKSVTFPNPSTAFVRFSTTETSPSGTVVKHYVSVVRYRYTDTPATNEWRFENPLGFQVYSYRRDQETVTTEDAAQ